MLNYEAAVENGAEYRSRNPHFRCENDNLQMLLPNRNPRCTRSVMQACHLHVEFKVPACGKRRCRRSPSGRVLTCLRRCFRMVGRCSGEPPAARKPFSRPARRGRRRRWSGWPGKDQITERGEEAVAVVRRQHSARIGGPHGRIEHSPQRIARLRVVPCRPRTPPTPRAIAGRFPGASRAFAARPGRWQYPDRADKPSLGPAQPQIVEDLRPCAATASPPFPPTASARR